MKEHREAVRALDEEIQKWKRAGCHVDVANVITATAGTSPYYFPDLVMVCGSQKYPTAWSAGLSVSPN